VFVIAVALVALRAAGSTCLAHVAQAVTLRLNRTCNSVRRPGLISTLARSPPAAARRLASRCTAPRAAQRQSRRAPRPASAWRDPAITWRARTARTSGSMGRGGGRTRTSQIENFAFQASLLTVPAGESAIGNEIFGKWTHVIHHSDSLRSTQMPDGKKKQVEGRLYRVVSCTSSTVTLRFPKSDLARALLCTRLKAATCSVRFGKNFEALLPTGQVMMPNPTLDRTRNSVIRRAGHFDSGRAAARRRTPVSFTLGHAPPSSAIAGATIVSRHAKAALAGVLASHSLGLVRGTFQMASTGWFTSAGILVVPASNT
jgi:hypothetical protein